jgi:anti-sigma factor RsiW
MTQAYDFELIMMKALDGEALAAGESAALEAHFAAHPKERALFERMTVVDRAFADVPLVGAPAGFSAGVMAAVRMAPAPRAAPAREAGAARFMVAAGLAVFGALSMVIFATVLAILIPPQAWLTWLSAASAIVDSFLDFPRAIMSLAFSFTRGVVEAPAGLAALGALAALVGGWMFAMLRLFAPRTALARR